MSETNVSQATQTKISLVTKVAFLGGFIGISAVAAVMYLAPGDENGGGGNVAEHSMMVADIAKAIVTPNVGWQNVAFLGISNVVGADPIPFGTIDAGFPATDGWHDGEAYQLDLPLELSINGSHPALNISLQMNGAQAKTICVPASISEATTLYVASTGNTYSNPGLTMPVFTNCEFVQANSLAVSSITRGRASIAYVGPTVPSATVNFLQDNIIIGSAGNGDLFGPQAPDARAIPNSKSPLHSQYFGIASRNTEPSRTITLQYGTESKAITLCLPEAQPPASGLFWGDLYFDNHGTPFTDSLLQTSATLHPCDQLLANSLRDTSITGGTMSTRSSSDPYAGLYFIHDLANQAETRTTATTSALTVDTGTSMDGSTSPLALYIVPEHNQTGPIKARTFDVQYLPIDNSPTPQTVTLCFPETQMIPVGAGGLSYPVLYFYDKNGTPYFDNLLTRPALNAACMTIRANFLNPQNVTTASAPVSLGSHGLYIYNRGDLAGVIDGSTWTPNANFVPDTIARPLAIVLGGGSASDLVDVPDMAIQLEADGVQKTLCFRGQSQAHPGALAAFYDLNGQPYADALLQQPIGCSIPTISNVQATPTATGATISWTSAPATTGKVEYGTTTTYGASVSDATSSTTHQVILLGLTSGATYHYRITVMTANGSAVSTDYTFVTSSVAQPTAPARRGGKTEVIR